MTTRKAETYPPETYFLNLAEVRQIVFEMQHVSERSEVDGLARHRPRRYLTKKRTVISRVTATTAASASIRILMAYVQNVADDQAVAVMPWLDRGGAAGDSGRVWASTRR